MDNGINQIKHGIYTRLSKKYFETYGEEKAPLLAAAVTNELFSLPPGNETAKSFLEGNRGLVNQCLSQLKEDEDIKKGATHAIRIRMNIIYNTQQSGAYDKKLGRPYVRLVERGLAMKEEKDKTAKEFIAFAERFYKISIDK